LTLYVINVKIIKILYFASVAKLKGLRLYLFMKIQILVSTMNQLNHDLLTKMNIQTEAIFINQSNEYKFEEFDYLDNTIKFFTFNERGIGLSRNNALMRADGDICVFADDDVRYVDDYEKIIEQEFLRHPNADIILFNVPSTNIDRPTTNITKCGRVRWYNSLRYGAVNIVAKTNRIKKANIYFSLLFGGGTKYSSGEDSLFIFDCLRKRLKIYKSPQIIGYVSQKESTWFHGYDDKYFIDKGVFFANLNRRFAYFLCIQFAIRHYKLYSSNKKFFEVVKLMKRGIREFDSDCH